MKRIIILRFLCLAFCLCLLLPASAIRIVSLSPSVTYDLQQIGADSCIVGRTSFCPEPLDGHASEIVGNVLEVNLEKILALKPDLVLCMAFTQDQVQERLQGLGIEVRDFSTPDSFDEICEQALEIGRLAGMEAEAEALVARERAEVRLISERFLPDAGQASSPEDKALPAGSIPSRHSAGSKVFGARTFFQIGSDPVFPVIEGTFMNQYLEFLGLDNIVKDYKGNGITQEYVVAAAPQIMFISRMSGLGPQIAEEWKRFGSIPAVQDGHVFMVDDDEACCPTPVFFRKTLQYLAQCLESMLVEKNPQ